MNTSAKFRSTGFDDDFDRRLAIANELGAVFKTAGPEANVTDASYVQFLCGQLRGAGRPVDDLVSEIARLAPAFLSARQRPGASRQLEALRKVITNDLLYHVRVRLLLLQQWKRAEEEQNVSGMKGPGASNKELCSPVSAG